MGQLKPTINGNASPAATAWTFIWQNGMEMQIGALSAPDREFDDETNQSGWAITDGKARLRGEAYLESEK